MRNQGKLFIVATPIGNLEDITVRAIKTLLSVPVIACEDTRKTGQLVKYLKNKYAQKFSLSSFSQPKLISYYDEIETFKAAKILSLLKEENDVALISESGTPLIADPGYKLIKACLKSEIQIIPIPGPTAFISALLVSGLPPNRVFFVGFLPAKKSPKEKLLTSLLQCFKTLKQKTTLVCYESPHRLYETLQIIKEVFGDCDIVVARELTKIHEEIFRGAISEALAKFHSPKGEFALLINF